MFELAYLFVLAAGCGLCGGVLARVITAAMVAEMEGRSHQISTTHIWIYSTGGRGTATWGDVWRVNGGGPEETAKTAPPVICGIAFVAAVIGFFYPPPLLAEGPAVPLFTWWNVLMPLITFVVALGLGVFLGEAAVKTHLLAGAAVTLPGLALVIPAILSYFFDFPMWLCATLFYLGLAAMLIVPAVFWFTEQRNRYYGDSIPLAALVAALVLNGAVCGVVAAGLNVPRYNPLANSIGAVSPGPGIPGPNGEPPLRLVEFKAPMQLVSAGCIGETLPHKESYDRPTDTFFAHLRDSTGADLVLCFAPLTKFEGSRRVAIPFQKQLLVGGVHPLDPSARLPFDEAEADRFVKLLREAVVATGAEAANEDLLSIPSGESYAFRIQQEIASREPGTVQPELFYVDAAATMLRELEAYRQGTNAEAAGALPFAGPGELARRYYNRTKVNAEAAARELREPGVVGPGYDFREKWEQFAPTLAARLWRGPRLGLAEYLHEQLRGQISASPGTEEGDLNYPWQEPQPRPEETAVYLLRKPNGGSEYGDFTYLEIDTRSAPPLQWRYRHVHREPPSGYYDESGRDVAGYHDTVPADSAYSPNEFDDPNGQPWEEAGPTPMGPTFGGDEPQEVPEFEPRNLDPPPVDPEPRPEPSIPGPPPREFRTWTSADGAFRVEAKLLAVGKDLGVVALERTDRQTIYVPLERLSEADRDYVAAEQERE